MTELVQRRAVPVDRLEIGLRRRDLHIVLRGHVEGAAAADAEVDAVALISASTLGSISPAPAAARRPRDPPADLRIAPG